MRLLFDEKRQITNNPTYVRDRININTIKDSHRTKNEEKKIKKKSKKEK